MPQLSPASRGEHILLVIASVFIIIAGLKAAASLLVPLLLAAFIAIICLPPLFFLLHRGLNVSISVCIITCTLILLGLLLSLFVGSSIADFSHNLPLYQTRIQGQISEGLQWLIDWGFEMPVGSLLESINPASMMAMAGNFLNSLGNALTNAFFMLLIVIFILFEAVALPHKWAIMDVHAPDTDAFAKFLSSVHRYLVIKSLASIATGICISIWLSILGVDYPILWGLLAFLFNFVPNIGSIIAAVPAILLALIQLGSDSALYAALGYLVVNIIMGNIIEPRFMGKGVGLSTLIVFLSLVIWGWILGPVGMLLSVPLTMIVKLACESKAETQWIAVFLGPDIEGPPVQNRHTQKETET